MEDPVLDDLSAEFLRRDYHVVLFNSRGVGASAGRGSLSGIQEAHDLQKVVEWALNAVINVQTVVLVGYSYGSLLTSLCPSPKTLFPDRVFRSSHILISHPLGPAHFLTFFNHGKYERALDELLVDPNSNVLAIHGNRDQFTGCDRYEKWVNHALHVRREAGMAESRTPLSTHSSASSGDTLHSRPSHSRASSKESLPAQAPAAPRKHGEYQASIVHHVDHFWRGHHTKELQHVVRDWIRRLDHGEFDLSDD